MKGVWAVINDRYALVTFHENPGYLYVYDILIPTAPVLLPSPSVSINNGPNGSKYQDGYLYIPTNTGRVYVVNVSNPSISLPTGISNQPFGNSQLFAVTVDAESNYAYAANAAGQGLLIFDVTNKAAPVYVNKSASYVAAGVTLRGNYVYVTNYSTGVLNIYDITTRTAPVLVGSVGGMTNPCAVTLDPTRMVAYVSGYSTANIWSIDVTNPVSPVLLDQVTPAGNNLNNFNSMGFIGDVMYALSENGFATMISIINPANLCVVCSYDTGYGTGTGVPLIYNDLWLIPDRIAANTDQFRVRRFNNNINVLDGDLHLCGNLFINTITGTGNPVNILPSGQLVQNTSSIRYKENVIDASFSSSVLDHLKPVYFNWKETGEQDLGFIAEDVNQELPVAVNLDANGQPNGIKDRALIALVVKEMQNLRKEVADIRLRLNSPF
jgi:hypothetical protein